MSTLSSRPVLRTAALVIGLGLLVAWASLELRIHTRLDTIHNMSNILHGRPMEFGADTSTIHPFYNRVMFPSLLWTFTHGVGELKEGQWYILLRLASCIFGLGAFAFACDRVLRPTQARLQLAVALMALSIIGAFAFPWEDPTDVIDLGAQALAVVAALDGRLALCLLIAVVFAANRESAAYAGISWFVLAPPRPLLKRGTESFVICAASYAVAIALRLAISRTGASNWIALPHNIESLIQAVRTFAIVGWFGIEIGMVLFLSACVDLSTDRARRFVLLALLFAVPGLLFGWVEDVRVFLPCAVMMCFAVAAHKDA
ncbi:MAG TPA: hypothetical protein VKY24_04035 [Reyranella sp.]|nr:hypothetical protein [Reyranella sp.]